eukprot:gene15226-20511_t
MSKITLQCVKEGRNKLRIRFHSFTDENGKEFANVYDNSFNCQFPRAIRKEGRFYEIGPEDLNLVANGSKCPFYKVRTSGIRIVGLEEDEVPIIMPTKRAKKQPSSSTKMGSLAPIDISTMKIYAVNECVACLGDAPTEVFLPCAHKCVCKGCCLEIKKHNSLCPLCRRSITASISV